MHRAKDEFEKRGVKPVVVGHSSVRWAKAFVADTGIDLPVYVDENREAFQALGFKRPLLGFLKPVVFKRAMAAKNAGFSQKGVQGDAFQLGGVVLLQPDGTIPYFFASETSGDHPNIADLLAATSRGV